ncbi:MAG: glucosaminidase domain-containing protein [Prevotella sp.]|nr:glucosaminidase domain-containing protein [Candidatus Equicola stercoris]
MKHRIIFLFSFVCMVCLTNSISAQYKPYQDYIAKYSKVAIQQMKKYHIPASITMAQAVLESGAGRSRLARVANNHFGIKCGGDWQGRQSYHDDDLPNECFRYYDDPLESYEDHSLFLTGKRRYASLFNLKITDYRGWAHGLKKAGYATNPSYAHSLIKLIEDYELWKLDNGDYDDPALKKFFSSGSNRQIFFNNKNYYIKVRANDTFKSLSKEFDISARKLAKYNERNKHDVLVPGEILYLKKKQKKAEKKYKKIPHIVQAGESMYSIAQRYGIRLKSLYKLNKLSPDYIIQPGDQLRVR